MINKLIIYGVAALAVVFVIWLLLTVVFKKENAQNQPDVAAQKAATDSAKSENPFKTESPLSGVEANPFDKTKKVLNPFEN